MKLWGLYPEKKGKKVAPFVGAGIEIVLQATVIFISVVAPFVGAGIEI